MIDRIAAAVDQFLADETFSALLVHCAGSTFVAGADISIFDEPDFTTVHVGAFGDPGSSAELDKFLDPSTLGL